MVWNSFSFQVFFNLISKMNFCRLLEKKSNCYILDKKNLKDSMRHKQLKHIKCKFFHIKTAASWKGVFFYTLRREKSLNKLRQWYTRKKMSIKIRKTPKYILSWINTISRLIIPRGKNLSASLKILFCDNDWSIPK